MEGGDSERKEEEASCSLVNALLCERLSPESPSHRTLFWSPLSFPQPKIDMKEWVFFTLSSVFSFAKSKWPREGTNHLFLILNNGTLSSRALPVALRLIGMKPKESLGVTVSMDPSSDYRTVSYLFPFKGRSVRLHFCLNGTSLDVPHVKKHHWKQMRHISTSF